MLVMAQIVPWYIPAYWISLYGRKEKLKRLVPCHTTENWNVNRIVNNGGNEKLPITMDQNQNGFTNPPELPPQVPTNGVEEPVSHNGCYGTVICLVAN